MPPSGRHSARFASLALSSSGAGLIFTDLPPSGRHSARFASLALSSSGAGLIFTDLAPLFVKG
ncbi:MAG TPA: hypothetical protein VFB74_17970, partial [Kribbellaceae bacterium]|nr:hypothetical protein [Kribbellaceae bacterium]